MPKTKFWKPGILFAALVLTANFVRAAETSSEQGWYRFQPKNDPGPGQIGLTNWLDKPAGKYGRIVRQGDAFVYHGHPIKLWGINLCFRNCAPPKSLAEKRARFYAKFGINAVRLHKFADSHRSGIVTRESSIRYDPAALDRMDYQIAQFKKEGIYVELSANFGTITVSPDDRKIVPFANEFDPDAKASDSIRVPPSAFFYSPTIQNLQIDQIVNLLKHRNPYTGMTYAKDPVVDMIEIINEQSVLFYTSMIPLEKSATLRRRVGRRFCQWLRHKYGNEKALLAAWGQKALNSFTKLPFAQHEDLDRGTILPLGNPWYWDPQNLNSPAQAYRRQRLLDTLQFLFGLQQQAYARYENAVRKAGYQGMLIGSNWQAGRAYSHFANLYTDYQVGTIDRHNYFGGGRGVTEGKPFNNRSMLSKAGSGILSAGLQQVANRPFMLSEWIHVFPNEWGAEGPAIIGAYGMGLQGWDASYIFQNGDHAGYSARLGDDRWDATAPEILGLFPAVARQILRGDVKESQVQAPRYVNVPSLFKGKLGFRESVKQNADEKELNSGVVPIRTLAAARCVVDFTPEFRKTPSFDLKPFQSHGSVVSSTGQLRWHDQGDETSSYFTINSAGTKAVVGFSSGQTYRLGPVTISPQSHFSAIYVVAQSPTGTIADDHKLLVVALARARNTDMQFNAAGNVLEKMGTKPILLEPVKATITIHRGGTPHVTVLDQDGKLTKTTLPVTNGTFTIDGTRDRTPFYLIEY